MKAPTPNIKVMMKEEIKFSPDLEQDKDVLLLLQINIALKGNYTTNDIKLLPFIDDIILYIYRKP